MSDISFVTANKVIAIIRGQGSEYILNLAQALHEGGVNLIEVTFPQNSPELFSETARSISLIAKRFGGLILPGAGTVVTREQVKLAYDAGARYIISPNTDVDVIKYTKSLGLLSFPGAMTPTEIMTAHDAGADIVKLFPAAQLGTDYIKAIRAPISHVKLMAVGGITHLNAREFIQSGCVGVGVGGSLVNAQWARDGQWDKITAMAKEYIKAVDNNG